MPHRCASERNGTPSLTKCCNCRPPRISASCFRTLSHRRELVFFTASPDSIITVFEIAVTPPPAAAARLDSAPLPLPEKKSTVRKAPARADRPFKGIALILASTIFLGTSDVTAKYLSATLPSIEIAWIRFLVFALIMTPAMMPGSPLFALQTNRLGPASDARRRAAGFVAVLHLRPAVPAHRGSFRHRLRRAAVRHRAVDRVSRREGRPAPLDRDRRSAWSACSSSCGRAPARFTPPRSFRWSRRWPGPAR